MKLSVYDNYCRIDSDNPKELLDTMNKINQLENDGIVGKWLWLIDEGSNYVEIFKSAIKLPEGYDRLGVYDIAAKLMCKKYTNQTAFTEVCLVLKNE